MTGYYLLDRPRRGPTKWYATRRSPVRIIVLHITAGLEDLDATDDQSAEATARYAANTDRAVSWHSGADTDSVIRLLPTDYTAFHCAGYNSPSLGLEISKKTVQWRGMDPEWVRRTLDNAAAAVLPWMAEFAIPARLLTREEVDAGGKGFTYHSRLDPTRRSDPGPDFPWDSFAARLTADQPEEDDLLDSDRAMLQAIADEVGKLAVVVRDPTTGVGIDVDSLVAAVGRLEVVIRDPTSGLSQRLAEVTAKLDALLAQHDGPDYPA